MKDFPKRKSFFIMNKLLKLTQVLVFTVLILIIITFIWQFFNPFAKLLFLPLGILSIYYLLLNVFVRLNQNNTSKAWFYIGVFFIIIPLISFSIAYKPIMEFSYNIVNAFGN